jgi:hypothetical protein
MSLYAECPRTSTRTPLQRVLELELAVSPRKWTRPRVLKLKRPRWILRSPPAQMVHKTPLVQAVL